MASYLARVASEAPALVLFALPVAPEFVIFALLVGVGLMTSAPACGAVEIDPGAAVSPLVVVTGVVTGVVAGVVPDVDAAIEAVEAVVSVTGGGVTKCGRRRTGWVTAAGAGAFR